MCVRAPCPTLGCINAREASSPVQQKNICLTTDPDMHKTLPATIVVLFMYLYRFQGVMSRMYVARLDSQSVYGVDGMILPIL